MPPTLSNLGAGLQTRPSPAVPDRNAVYLPGDIVPWHFMPGIIVASFFASLTGTLLTVELLHRKRLGKSIMSRYESCSIQTNQRIDHCIQGTPFCMRGLHGAHRHMVHAFHR